MNGEEPELVLAVQRAYLLGVGALTVLLWLWLLTATAVLLRRQSAAVVGILTAVYTVLGYVGYLSLLHPITFRFMSSVATVEPFTLHPAWARVGIPSVSIVGWLFILRLLRRKIQP